METTDKKSLFGQRRHSPTGTDLEEHFHGEKIAKSGWRSQKQRESHLQAGRGSPGLLGGGGNRVRDTGEEQTCPAASAQPFAYIITGSVS